MIFSLISQHKRRRKVIPHFHQRHITHTHTRARASKRNNKQKRIIMGTIKAPLEQPPPLVPEFTNEQDVLQHYNNLTSVCEEARSKINELSNQAKEHELVVDAIKDLDPERKCFRLVGGVLVERKGKEVLPAVKGNKEKLDGVVERINEQLNTKEMELLELKRKYQIRERGEQPPPPDE